MWLPVVKVTALLTEEWSLLPILCMCCLNVVPRLLVLLLTSCFLRVLGAELDMHQMTHRATAAPVSFVLKDYTEA